MAHLKWKREESKREKHTNTPHGIKNADIGKGFHIRGKLLRPLTKIKFLVSRFPNKIKHVKLGWLKYDLADYLS